MSKRHPPLLKYNERNCARAIAAILSCLSIDLLPKKFIEENLKNPTFGHCHTAAGCLYKIFGSQTMHLYRALDQNGIYHWWVQDLEGNIIDPTASQYSKRTVKQLYKRGKKSSLLGFAYKQRVLVLLERVRDEMKI
jgi:hypothetical protein